MNQTVPKVIVIPQAPKEAQEKEQRRSMRVAAYCRVSTNDEDQLTSYENQLAYYTEKIMNEPNWTLVEVFADEGKTGTSTCKRENFLRMIRMCRKGKIDMILAKSVSRFARNTVDTLEYTRELRKLGIPVIFEEYNINSIHPESEFFITLYGAIAQNESENISANVRWGKRQAMKSGHVPMQYKNFYGYEKGEDGRPKIIPEQAEVVRFIYKRFLAGDTLRGIKAQLESEGVLTAAGKTEWRVSSLQSILTNEKYCGDALLQKTFIADCISKKVIKNVGQLPKYLVQGNHDPIVSREVFDAAQLEMARRRALSAATKKSAPTGLGKYSGKYALTGMLKCGECGTLYRRCVWTQHGEKRAVWRCSSRLDYGKKYCKHSPTLDETPLQEAIMKAVNSTMSDKETLIDLLADAMQMELAPMAGETMTLAEIDRAIEELGRQFDKLLEEASQSSDTDSYTERFRKVSDSIAHMKDRRNHIVEFQKENSRACARIRAASEALKDVDAGLKEWDDSIIYQLLECVTVLSDTKIKVSFRSGVEIEQNVEKAERKRRKTV